MADWPARFVFKVLEELENQKKTTIQQAKGLVTK